MDEPRTLTLTITDARDIDGDPYEAAESAFANLDDVLLAADEALDAVDVLAQGADLQRQHDITGEMDATKWREGVVATRLGHARESIASVRRDTSVLRRAVTFDPGAHD